jgi:hypothetical protein
MKILKVGKGLAETLQLQKEAKFLCEELTTLLYDFLEIQSNLNLQLDLGDGVTLYDYKLHTTDTTFDLKGDLEKLPCTILVDLAERILQAAEKELPKLVEELRKLRKQYREVLSNYTSFRKIEKEVYSKYLEELDKDE